MSDDEVLWERQPHTAAKHEMLRRYLGAWFGIFGNHPRHRRVNIIDGFAGPGVYSGGEPGSPVIAVKTLLGHSGFASMNDTQFNFLFVEQRQDRVDHLERELAALRGPAWPVNVGVSVERGNFFEVGQQLLDAMPDGRSLAPTFFFIDPFGYKDVPLSLIRQLLAYGGCELFFYFDFNSVNRFGTSGVVDEAFEAYFGTTEFRDAPPAGDPDRAAYFHDLFERQLRQECNLSYLQSFRMQNAKGKTGYYLFFGTRNLVAFDKMKQAMWTVDPSGQYQFSDQFANQDVLFGAELDTEPLRRALLAEFAGRTVDIQEVTDWTVANTPFAGNHVKTATLKPMELEGVILAEGKPARRRGTYADGTRITFP